MICAPAPTPQFAPSNKTNVVVLASTPVSSFGSEGTQSTGPAVMLTYASTSGGSGQNYIICS